ncbi:3-phosphoshikimate 1-carboxyvinyltransferase [Pontimicrobium sp. IMCC45349]|uniref:3-phosphoshikimate 1-carboxyvinyltransferase n=1 Tax=Pontimicrobium sp. IMCC45349 TaxID=3391574 RepID=UPI0039A33E83
MHIKLHKSKVKTNNNISITGSKSESNRLLLLQALFPSLQIDNLSNSDDSQLMQKALVNKTKVVDIHHAGTAMRFLTAFFSIQNNLEVKLTGSSRMQERPIAILVDALKSLGADIQYVNNIGYPPISIKGKKLTKSKVTLKANVSSQYISALLLIAPKLENGIELNLEGKITSIPYINMTLSLLNQIGVETSFIGNVIKVKSMQGGLKINNLVVESDWSSVSYFYSIIALSSLDTQITISSYSKQSLQGDSVLVDIYKHFGVETVFKEHSITIIKKAQANKDTLKLDLSNAPDIAQTIAVTCLGLKIPCELIGLHTLKIKETDRLVALKTEIEKFGTKVNITDASLSINKFEKLNSDVYVDTYHDHRMAMAFAPLALHKEFIINDANVVSKSYPDFWSDLAKIGFETSYLKK